MNNPNDKPSFIGRLVLNIALACIGLNSYAQSINVCKWSITGGVGISEYAGHIGIGFFQFDMTKHPLGEKDQVGNARNSPGITVVSINKYHNESYDWSLRAYHGEWGYFASTDSGSHFHHRVNGIEFTPRWKFWQRGEGYRFVPYLTYGLGVRKVQTSPLTPFFGFFGRDKEAIYELNIPAGVGFNFIITRNFSINAQSNIAWTSNKNNSLYGAPNFNWLWNQTIGLTFTFCKDKPLRCYRF